MAAMLRRSTEVSKQAVAAIGDFILPPICLACENTVVKQGVLCPRCWSGMRFIERPYCAVTGTPFSFDLGEQALSADAIANPPVYSRARAVALYDEIARTLVQGLKFADRTDIAPWMANWMARAGRELIAENPLVVAVPLHKRRLILRRFNQSAELARHIARQNELEYVPEALLRIRATRQQVGLGARQRRKNVRGAFRVPPVYKARLAGRKILLIDDVLTTGATIEAASRALLRGGAASVDCLTFARVVRGED